MMYNRVLHLIRNSYKLKQRIAEMSDYKAIVTGGAKGIGHAITSTLLEAGGKVVYV